MPTMVALGAILCSTAVTARATRIRAVRGGGVKGTIRGNDRQIRCSMGAGVCASGPGGVGEGINDGAQRTMRARQPNTSKQRGVGEERSTCARRGQAGSSVVRSDRFESSGKSVSVSPLYPWPCAHGTRSQIPRQGRRRELGLRSRGDRADSRMPSHACAAPRWSR